MAASRASRGGMGPGGLEPTQSCVSWGQIRCIWRSSRSGDAGDQRRCRGPRGLGVGWVGAICWPQSPSNPVPGRDLDGGFVSDDEAVRSRAWVVARLL